MGNVNGLDELLVCVLQKERPMESVLLARVLQEMPVLSRRETAVEHLEVLY